MIGSALTQLADCSRASSAARTSVRPCTCSTETSQRSSTIPRSLDHLGHQSTSSGTWGQRDSRTGTTLSRTTNVRVRASLGDVREGGRNPLRLPPPLLRCQAVYLITSSSHAVGTRLAPTGPHRRPGAEQPSPGPYRASQRTWRSCCRSPGPSPGRSTQHPASSQ